MRFVLLGFLITNYVLMCPVLIMYEYVLSDSLEYSLRFVLCKSGNLLSPSRRAGVGEEKKEGNKTEIKGEKGSERRF